MPNQLRIEQEPKAVITIKENVGVFDMFLSIRPLEIFIMFGVMHGLCIASNGVNWLITDHVPG